MSFVPLVFRDPAYAGGPIDFVFVPSDVEVTVSGVSGRARVGGLPTRVPVQGVSAALALGTVQVRQSAIATPIGVRGRSAVGFVLVWSAVKDMQTPNWQNVVR